MIGLWRVIRCMKGAATSRPCNALICYILLMCYVSSLSALNPTNKNAVTTVSECKKYLCKYGYLAGKCECHIQLRRQKRSVATASLFAPTEFEPDESAAPESNENNLDMSDNDTTLVEHCSEPHFTEAFQKYQSNYNLNITGVCDNETKAVMSQRRCGQPDTDAKPPSVSTNSPQSAGDQSRQTRSLRDLLTEKQDSHHLSHIRKRQLQSYLDEIYNEKITPRRLKLFAEQKHKRSVLAISTSDDFSILTKRKLTWRLPNDSGHNFEIRATQRATLRMAFNHWSEVLPLCFQEKDGDPDVDIKLRFLTGIHLGCIRQFDGSGGEIAHKYYHDVHFDNSEHYKYYGSPGFWESQTFTSNDERVSLLLSATHEIGHVLGLSHSLSTNSIMNPLHHMTLDESFQLAAEDMVDARSIYGPCTGTFDEVFDYVRNENGERVFNTYLFRRHLSWMYENSEGRPKTGQPRNVSEWAIVGSYSSVPISQDIDAFMHYFDVKNGKVRDEYYFFRADQYFQYNPEARDSSNKIIATGFIASKFPRGRYGVPNSLDAVFFNYNDKLTYFFKGQYVYRYNYTGSPSTNHHTCCEDYQTIVSLFPPKTQTDMRSPSGVSYADGVDSVYYSWSHRKLFFIKGEELWRVDNYKLGSAATNPVVYVGKWYDTWHYVCEVTCES